MEFVKKNRNRVEKGKGFTRYLLVNKPEIIETVSETIASTMKDKGKKPKAKAKEVADILEPIEYFYLETPNVPDNYFPLNIYGIYDRVTIEEIKI